MLMSDPPSSDGALLAGLSAAVSVMAGFGMVMYSLMQPTVLPNAPFELARQSKQPAIVQRAASQDLPLDVEQSAIAMAARENEIQGLRPTLAARTEPAPTQAHAQATPPKPAKPKRAVAKAPRRDERTYADNWGGGGRSFFGGFW
jgi:hypothetical protein